jgi:hypothetical protein
MTETIGNSIVDPTTTLNGAITNTASSIVVHDATELPSSGQFRILVWDGLTDGSKEIIKIESRSGATLTVSSGGRAIEGPYAAQSHADNDLVELVVTKGSLDGYFGNPRVASRITEYLVCR